MKLQDTIKLSSSRAIPQIGFGVYKSPASVCVASVQTALQAGYRHVDSAQYYENEAEVGQAIKGSGLPREDVFVTTKTFGNGTSTEEYLSVPCRSLPCPHSCQ
jgi:diketogulonate reductase-like aldo/keto reductase